MGKQRTVGSVVLFSVLSDTVISYCCCDENILVGAYWRVDIVDTLKAEGG